MKCSKFAIHIFLVFCFTKSFSQYKKIVIADRNNGYSLAYATVKILNTTRGYYADKNGIIKMPAFEKDSFLVEYTGYISRTFIINLTTDTVFLSRKEYELLGVEVKNIRVKKEVGSFKYRKMSSIFFGASTEYASKINLSEIKGSYRVQQLYIPLDINKKTFKDCIVKLHLYIEGENGSPGEDILTKPVFITSDSFIHNDYLIDISDQKIILSEKYLYLGIECIMDKITALYNPNYSERKAFNQHAKLSPISLYFSKEKQFFSGGYGHKFTRFLNSRSYKWDGNTYSSDPINFAAGLVILCNQDSSE
jgi:hypothetical protein